MVDSAYLTDQLRILRKYSGAPFKNYTEARLWYNREITRLTGIEWNDCPRVSVFHYARLVGRASEYYRDNNVSYTHSKYGKTLKELSTLYGLTQNTMFDKILTPRDYANGFRLRRAYNSPRKWVVLKWKGQPEGFVPYFTVTKFKKGKYGAWQCDVVFHRTSQELISATIDRWRKYKKDVARWGEPVGKYHNKPYLKQIKISHLRWILDKCREFNFFIYDSNWPYSDEHDLGNSPVAGRARYRFSVDRSQLGIRG